MNGVAKGMILYIVSPIDACSGPIDDIILILIGPAAQKGTRTIEDCGD